MYSAKSAFLLFLFLLPCSSLRAQAQSYDRSSENSLRGARGSGDSVRISSYLDGWDWGISHRFGFYAFDSYRDARDSAELYENDTILHLRGGQPGLYQAFARARLLHEAWDGPSSDGDGSELEDSVFDILDRFWVELDLSNLVRPAVAERDEEAQDLVRPKRHATLRVGQFFTEWGDGLTFSNVLLGADANVELNALRLRALAGITPWSITSDFDLSRPNAEEDTQRLQLGLEIGLDSPEFEAMAPYAFVLGSLDANERPPILALGGEPEAAIDAIYDYDAVYFGFGARGRLWGAATSVRDVVWEAIHGHRRTQPRTPGTVQRLSSSPGKTLDYHFEIVHERGLAASRPDYAIINVPRTPPFVVPRTELGTLVSQGQTRDDIDAWALAMGLRWDWNDGSGTSFDGEWLLGTGDSDRLAAGDTLFGNLSGTEDHSFNSLGYKRTGHVLSPDLSNLSSFRFGARTNVGTTCRTLKSWDIRRRLLPREDNNSVTVQGDLYFLFKEDRKAPMHFETADERFLGWELDGTLSWHVLSDLELRARAGVLVPGNALKYVEDSKHDAMHFFHLGVIVGH